MRPVSSTVFNIWLHHSSGVRLVAQGLGPKRAMQLAADLFDEYRECDVHVVPVSRHVFNKPRVLRDLGRGVAIPVG